MVLAEFRQHYPQGSLVGELVDIDRGTYIVKVSVEVEDIVLASGLAAADRVETAEDAARERAIAALVLKNHPITERNKSSAIEHQTSSNHQEIVNQPQVRQVEVKPVQPKDSSDNGSTEHKNQAANTAASSDVLDSQPESKVDSSKPSSIVVPKTIVEQEVLEEKIVSEPAMPLEETTAGSSGNLFAGTQANEETVEQLLADGANISVADSSSTAVLDADAKMEFTEMKHKTDLEIKRLGWTKDDGQEFLRSRYGKRSRLQLTDEQLWEFLQYLEAQPNPS